MRVISNTSQMQIYFEKCRCALQCCRNTFFEFIYIFVIYKFSFHLKSYSHHVQAFFLIRNLITLLSCRNSTTSCIQSLLCSFSSCTGTRLCTLCDAAHMCVRFMFIWYPPSSSSSSGRHVMKTLFCCKRKKFDSTLHFNCLHFRECRSQVQGPHKNSMERSHVHSHFCQWGSTCQHKNETIVIYDDLGTKRKKEKRAVPNAFKSPQSC